MEDLRTTTPYHLGVHCMTSHMPPQHQVSRMNLLMHHTNYTCISIAHGCRSTQQGSWPLAASWPALTLLQLVGVILGDGVVAQVCEHIQARQREGLATEAQVAIMVEPGLQPHASRSHGWPCYQQKRLRRDSAAGIHAQAAQLDLWLPQPVITNSHDMTLCPFVMHVQVYVCEGQGRSGLSNRHNPGPTPPAAGSSW